jgi:hypothetical protein
LFESRHAFPRLAPRASRNSVLLSGLSKAAGRGTRNAISGLAAVVSPFFSASKTTQHPCRTPLASCPGFLGRMDVKPRFASIRARLNGGILPPAGRGGRLDSSHMLPVQSVPLPAARDHFGDHAGRGEGGRRTLEEPWAYPCPATTRLLPPPSQRWTGLTIGIGHFL